MDFLNKKPEEASFTYIIMARKTKLNHYLHISHGYTEKAQEKTFLLLEKNMAFSPQKIANI